jgi:hypothetical protein
MPQVIQIDVGNGGNGLRHQYRPTRATLMESLPPTVVIVFEMVMRAALVAFLLTAAYFVYAVAAGHVQAFEQMRGPGYHFERLKIVLNLQRAGTILDISGVYLAFYIFLSGYERQERFLMLGAVFALFYFGLPFLFFNVLAFSPENVAAGEILFHLRAVGDCCLSVAAFRLACEIVSILKNGIPASYYAKTVKKAAPRSGQPEAPRSLRMLKRCWELPYCQDFLLSVCPAWKRKKTCWKTGSGCMCDPGMMESLMQHDAGMANWVGSSQQANRAPKGIKKCHTCSIYLAHEEQKFNIISPLVPVISIGLLVVGWNYLILFYQHFARWTGQLIGAIALGPTRSLSDQWTHTFLDPVAQYSFLICGCLILISYALKFTEWAILDRKW